MRHGSYRVFQICPGTGDHWSGGVFEPVSPSTRRATVEPATGSLSHRCCFWQRVQFQPVLRHLLPPPLQNVAEPIRAKPAFSQEAAWSHAVIKLTAGKN